MCKGRFYSGNVKLEGYTRVQKAAKLNPRAREKEELRDVRETLMNIFTERKRNR